MKAVTYTLPALAIVLGITQVNVVAAGEEETPAKSGFWSQFKEDWKKNWGEVKHDVKHVGPEAKKDFKGLGKAIKEGNATEEPEKEQPDP
ncbi:MAG: hypothetical protein ACE5H7_12960 [Acidiferrobacterales bacterium]